MSSILKLDGRTVRGKSWKELSTSGKPLKQGVLISKKVCSFCNQTPAADKEVIECMSCHSHFHIKCLVKPVTEEFLHVVSENPSVWWFCLACLSCKNIDGTTVLTPDAHVENDVVMQRQLMSFKKEILTLVGETMENKFNSFANLLETNCEKKKQNPPTITTSLVSTSAPSKTWSSVASGSISAVADVTSKSVSDACSKELSLPQKPEKHVLLLEPTSPDAMSAEDSKKQLVSSINDAITGVNVEFCTIKKSGIVAIGFQDPEAKKIAEKKISQNENCTSHFSTREPRKLLPKVTVTGIHEVLFESCDKNNRDEMKSVLLDDILNRNPILRTMSDSPANVLSVVMIQKVMPTENTISYTAVLKMSSQIRKAIHDNGNRIYVSLNRCKVTDRYHVKQCYHCQKPGHLSKDCADKKENKSPACFYCSGNHQSKTCPTKEDRCCINCIRSSNPDMVKGAKSHTAASYRCPILQSHVNNIKEKTENWVEKNLIY